MKKFLWLILILGLSLNVAAAQDATNESAMPAPDLLQVDAAADLGAISPYVYGANLGRYSLIPPALMDTAKALGIKYIRFGGGDSDQQDLATTVLDMFVYQVRTVGAEPAVTVRLLGGTPEKAAELVRYANVEKGYDIHYWSIGNEPNLFVALMGAEHYTVEDLSRDWRAIAEAMLAVDPTIQFVGPDVTGYVPLSLDPLTFLPNSQGGLAIDAEGNDWLTAFLKDNGDLLAYVSIHRYPFPGLSGGRGPTIDELRTQAVEWDTVIPNLRQIIREAAGRDIPIAVTEINSNSANSTGGEASLDSFYNAIWLGDTLGHLIRNQVDVVAVWDMQGGAGRGWGLLAKYDVRPTYYTYIMYTHFGGELLSAASGDPDVSLYAAQRDDGTLTLMVINLGPDEKTKTLALNGFTPSGDAEVWRFDAEHNAEQIDSLALSDGATITVPGQSMTLFALPG